MRFQVIEIQVVTGLAQLIGSEPAPKGVAYLTPGKHTAPFVQGWYRNTEGAWQARIFDRSPPSRTVLADLDFCDDLEHAEEIFLGAWATANRLADEAGAPVPRSMLHNAAGEILLGNMFELCCYPDGAFRVVVFHDSCPASAKNCLTEAETIAALREFFNMQGEE